MIPLVNDIAKGYMTIEQGQLQRSIDWKLNLKIKGLPSIL